MMLRGLLTTCLLPALASAYFYCPSVNETGFQPQCCHSIVGQVGVYCTPALLIGGEPNWDCNKGPPLNVHGCCQSIGYKNPSTGYDLNLCTDPTTV